MDTTPISGIDSWPEVVALFLLVIAVSIVPQVGSWIAAHKAAKSAGRVEDTLANTNGGSHVKDALDRIESGLRRVEAKQNEHAERISELEKPKSLVARLLRR